MGFLVGICLNDSGGGVLKIVKSSFVFFKRIVFEEYWPVCIDLIFLVLQLRTRRTRARKCFFYLRKTVHVHESVRHDKNKQSTHCGLIKNKTGRFEMGSMTGNELALKCGVSRGTVDRALKGRPGINSQTREKILKAAQKYGYRPNFIGQALSTKKTMTIGVVIFDFRHSFFAELYSAFEHEADCFNYVTLPMLSYNQPEREIECINRLVDRNVDGLIILPVNSGAKYEAFLESLNIPVVCIGNRLSKKFPFSGIDDRQAVRDAINYLKGSSSNKIYYYCPPMQKKGTCNLYAQDQRLLGFEDCQSTNEIKMEAVTNYADLMQRLDGITGQDQIAILCSNDFHAVELQGRFRDTDENKFSNIKLMGFDGLDLLRFSYPAIPTVFFSRKAWALKAFGQIYKLISGQDASDELIPYEIIENMHGEFK